MARLAVALDVETGLIEAERHPGERVVAHRLALRLSAHGVEVVEEEEEHGQPPAKALLPEEPELLHAGEVDRLPDHAAPGRAVADVRDGDSAAVVEQSLVQRGAGRDRCRPADDRIVRVDAELREEGMHAAAEPEVEARAAPEDLRQQPVEEELDASSSHVGRVERAVEDAERLAAAEALHQ